MMTESSTAGENARTDRDAPTPEQRCDLSKFKLRILAVLAETDSAPSGQEVKDALEQYYDANVNHGRLYPNLDELVEWGLVAKGAKDRRTNSYDLTDDGRDLLRAEVVWLVDRTQGLSVVPPNDGGRA